MIVLITLITVLVLLFVSVVISLRKTESAYGVGWLVGVCTGFTVCWLMFMVSQ